MEQPTDPKHLTKDQVIDLLTSAAKAVQLKDFNFGHTGNPCTDENKIVLSDVLEQAVAYLDGSANNLKISVIDDVHRRFAIDTHWTFCGSTYRVVQHGPNGSVTFRSLASPDTYISYSGRQMIENVRAFRGVANGECFIEDIQQTFPVNSYWEGPLFGESANRVFKVAAHNSGTITFMDVKRRTFTSMHYYEFTTRLIASMKPREDLSRRATLS